MKIFKLMAIALVAMLGFSSCSEDCDHEFIEVDYSKALVGTWTSWEDGLAEAMVIKEDGSFSVIGITAGGNRHEDKGTLTVVNNKIALTFESSGETLEGRLELVQGESLSIVLNDKFDIRATYHYCKNDLADEVIGTWVCTFVSFMDAEMAINTYKEDGTALFTGFVPWGGGYMANVETTYEVVGDLMLQSNPVGEGVFKYLAFRLNYTPNATEGGDDVLTNTSYMLVNDEVVVSSASMIRVKEYLDLASKNYDYNNIYVSNVKGADKSFEFGGQTLNFSTLDGSIMDKLMKDILFNVSFTADKITYNCYYNGQSVSIDAPIVVDGNKMTIKMSANNSVYKDIEVYAFQDASNCQLHMYMPTASFEKFFANIGVVLMAKNGELNLNDVEAVSAIYNGVENAIETINVSFVMKARK